MPRMLTDEDLSLRHLPEVSDYSFSFQIPASSLPRGDDLMAPDNTFFEGTNGLSVLATPAPHTQQLLTRPPTCAIPGFTQRPSSLEPNPQSQQAQASLSSASPSTSYGHNGQRLSPIIGVSESSNHLESSEAEVLNKEERKRECQDPEEQQEQAPAFAKRSSLGSWSEARHSEIDLPQTGLLPQADPVVGDEMEEQQQTTVNPKGTRRTRSSNRSEQSMSLKQPQLIAGTKSARQSAAAGDTPKKSRRIRKAAKTKNERLQVDASIPNIITRAVHFEPEKPMDSSTADKALDSDLNLSSFVGSAGRLVMYGEQLMNAQFTAADSTIQVTEPNYFSGQKIQLDEHGIQDISMSLDDRQDALDAGHNTHANKFGGRDDAQEKPLTLSQLPRRKRSKLPVTVVEEQDNIVSALPPSSSVLQLMSGVPKKRQAPAPGPNDDQRARKRAKGTKNAVSVEAQSGLTTLVPAHTIASTSNGQLSALTSAASSVLSELGSSSSGADLNGSNVIQENGGGATDTYEENAADAGHANTTHSSDMISTSGCGSSTRAPDSGKPINAKQVVKRPVETRARTRTRMVPKISASVKGGRTLRPRSVSNPATMRTAVLRGKERGKRLARIQRRGEAHGKENSRTAQQEKEFGKDGDSELKRSDMTYSLKPTRPIEFKFASNLRILNRKGDGQNMSRSASSLSSSGGETNNASTRAHPIPDFKAIHSHFEASQMHRKEPIHPVIPQPFRWATDQRIRDRKQFDEMIKDKERDREQLEEQKQRERAEEEEREIRELRKRAIPKANIVPEWYKDAPKRKRDEETIGQGSR